MHPSGRLRLILREFRQRLGSRDETDTDGNSRRDDDMVVTRLELHFPAAGVPNVQ
jgi:hypothetical protein